MFEILRTPWAQAVVLLAILLIVSIIAWYVLARFRDLAKSDESTSDLMTDFREMHNRGALSQAEYRTIKTVLVDKFQDEINDNEETG